MIGKKQRSAKRQKYVGEACLLGTEQRGVKGVCIHSSLILIALRRRSADHTKDYDLANQPFPKAQLVRCFSSFQKTC